MSGWPSPTGGQEPKRKRSDLLGGGGWEPWGAPAGGGWEPWGAPAAAGGKPEVDWLGSAMAPLPSTDLMLAYAAVLDCDACSLPLKPPIFECDAGHAVCSPCHDKLRGAGGECRTCGVAVAGGYRRCRALERVVESILAACPNKAYGCEATPPYQALAQHIPGCPHAPCHCPGEGCGFVGSVAQLVDHAAGAHGWPVHRPYHARERTFAVGLRDGLNFVLSDYNDLLLLNVTRHPFCRAVSAVCIRAHTAAEKALEMTIELARPLFFSNHGLVTQELKTVFTVAFSDLSDGLPNSNDSHQFIVPKYAHGDHADSLNVWIRISANEASQSSESDMSRSSESESSDMGFTRYDLSVDDDVYWCDL
ncbi:unnamed protein product [Urochloa humidicola]